MKIATNTPALWPETTQTGEFPIDEIRQLQ
jgi:hypothetical protein